MNPTKKYSLKDFWKFINPDEKYVYEIRTKDYQWSKFLGTTNTLPYYSGGVFTHEYSKALEVLKKARKQITMWISVNPKKKVQIGDYKQYGGKDIFIESINHIFLDIDRAAKGGKATKEEKDKIHKFVDIIIEGLKSANIKAYCRIDSGNGEQLLIPLDEPILMPKLEYDAENKIWLENDTYANYKKLIREVFLKKMMGKFNTKKNVDRYGCEIDKSCGNIGRVCALPFTMNFKYDEPVERKILEISEGENEGLSDYLLDELNNLDLPVFNKKNIKSKTLTAEFKYKAKNIVDSTLAQFLLKYPLKPNTGINNTLMFQFKCLCKDNGIPLECPEVVHIKRMLDAKFSRNFSWNVPDNDFHFNPNIVNSYCIENMIEPLYEIWYDKVVQHNFLEHIFTWKNYTGAKRLGIEPITIEVSTIMSAVYDFVRIWDGTVEMVYSFIEVLEKAKGEVYAKWFLENVFEAMVEKMIPTTNIEEYKRNKKDKMFGYA